MLLVSGCLLLYTAVIVPVQICIWSYDSPCTMFPTLYFDVAVDCFFLVPGLHQMCCVAQTEQPLTTESGSKACAIQPRAQSVLEAAPRPLGTVLWIFRASRSCQPRLSDSKPESIPDHCEVCLICLITKVAAAVLHDPPSRLPHMGGAYFGSL